MASIGMQIVQAMVAAMTGATSVGPRIFQARVVPVAREEGNCIEVREGVERKQAVGANVDEATLTVMVEIIVRGDPWTVIADSIAVDAHRSLLRDPALQLLTSRIRHTGSDWTDHEADQTAGCLSLEYQIRYTVSATDLSNSTIL